MNGVFMLQAIRNPSASWGLIVFTAWSSFAHVAVMGHSGLTQHDFTWKLVGVAILLVIGAALIALAPAK